MALVAPACTMPELANYLALSSELAQLRGQRWLALSRELTDQLEKMLLELKKLQLASQKAIFTENEGVALPDWQKIVSRKG